MIIRSSKFSEFRKSGTLNIYANSQLREISDLRFQIPYLSQNSSRISSSSTEFWFRKISQTWFIVFLLCKSDHFNCRSREISEFSKSNIFSNFENFEISRSRQLKVSLFDNKFDDDQVLEIFKIRKSQQTLNPLGKPNKFSNHRRNPSEIKRKFEGNWNENKRKWKGK